MAKTKRLAAPKPGTYGAVLQEMGERDGVDIIALLEKVGAGDTRAAEAVVAYLRRRPELAEPILAHYSSAQSAWIEYGTGDPFRRFVLEGQAAEVRRELLGDSPTPLERLLGERIVICSLQVQIAEQQFMNVMAAGSTLPKAKFYEDLQDRAQRRYLAAIKALAQVRRLQLPAVSQLNVATNQVNLAQAAGASPAQAPAALPDHGAVTIDDVLTSQDVDTARISRSGALEETASLTTVVVETDRSLPAS